MRVRYRAMDGIVTEAAPGTLEHFLIERYILYTADEEQRLYRARLHHRPYPLQRAEVLDFEESVIGPPGCAGRNRIRCGTTRAKCGCRSTGWKRFIDARMKNEG